ncbi:MAG TPA: protein kinase, partial [Trichormus sp.]
MGLADRFDVIRCIGEGGMGSVYEVREKATGMHYALKMLKEQLVADQEAVRRLHREARTAMNLSHKNLCTIYGAE